MASEVATRANLREIESSAVVSRCAFLRGGIGEALKKV
jgi:hypothetical protein